MEISGTCISNCCSNMEGVTLDVSMIKMGDRETSGETRSDSNQSLGVIERITRDDET